MACRFVALVMICSHACFPRQAGPATSGPGGPFRQGSRGRFCARSHAWRCSSAGRASTQACRAQAAHAWMCATRACRRDQSDGCSGDHGLRQCRTGSVTGGLQAPVTQVARWKIVTVGPQRGRGSLPGDPPPVSAQRRATESVYRYAWPSESTPGRAGCGQRGAFSAPQP
jgi:hypothetical protein